MGKKVGDKAKHKRINIRGIGSAHDGEHQNERNDKARHRGKDRKNRCEYDLNYHDNRRKDKRKHPITHGRYSPSSEEELEEEFFLESELEESRVFEELSELELAFASLLEFLFKRASGPTA